MATVLSNIQLSLKTDRYRLESLIGSGGFGAVYLAYDNEMQRQVALKVLSAAPERDLVARFMREAQALSSLKHKGIVQIYQFGLLDSGQPYLVMEFLKGESLRQMLQREGTLSCMQAAQIALQLAEALAHAHAHGLIHRDIKPENVMLIKSGDEVSVRLLDFGICRYDASSDDAKATITRTGSVIGTPGYLSPEQCIGKAVDARTDIYSLGTMLFEMVVGFPPLVGDTAAATIWKHLNDEPPDILALDKQAKLPELLKVVLDKCLARTVEQRYPSAAELIADLEVLVSTSGNSQVVSERITLPKPQRRRKVPWNLILQVSAAVAVVLIAVVAFVRLATPETLSRLIAVLPPNVSQSILIERLRLTEQFEGRDNAVKAATSLLLSDDVAMAPTSTQTDISYAVYKEIARGGPVPISVTSALLRRAAAVLPRIEGNPAGNSMPLSLYLTLKDSSYQIRVSELTDADYKTLSWLIGDWEPFFDVHQTSQPGPSIRRPFLEAFAKIMQNQKSNRRAEEMELRAYLVMAMETMNSMLPDFDRNIKLAIDKATKLGNDSKLATAYLFKAAREIDVFKNRGDALKNYDIARASILRMSDGDRNHFQVVEEKLGLPHDFSTSKFD